MRACEPTVADFVEQGGVKVFYEVFGDGEPTIMLMPTWPIIHSRMWKAQVPYLARRFRVVTFDPRGTGRTERPSASESYGDLEQVADGLAVMDASGADRVVVVGACDRWGITLAAEQPERVIGLVTLAPWLPMGPADFPEIDFDAILDTDDGWAKENRHYWLRDWPGYVRFFMEEMLPEQHSTKQIDDTVAWGLEVDAETMLLVEDRPRFPATETEAEELCRRVRCPVLIVQGDHDLIIPPVWS